MEVIAALPSKCIKKNDVGSTQESCGLGCQMEANYCRGRKLMTSSGEKDGSLAKMDV